MVLVVVTCSRDQSLSGTVCIFAGRCGSRVAGKKLGGTLPLLVVALRSAGKQGAPGCGDSGARNGAVMCSNTSRVGQYII